MSYAKAMKHNRNPRKWRRTRVKDSGGMSLSGQRGQWLIFGKPTTAMTLKTVTENEFQEFLDAHPLAVPDGFKLVGAMTQSKWLESGIEVARRSDDSFGIVYEVAA